MDLTTAPAVEPLTQTEVKNYLRVDSDITEDDALITALIVAARRYCETFTRRAFITQTWTMYLDRFPANRWYITLPKSPLQSVTSIKYYDIDGTLQTWSSSKYEVDSSDTIPARVSLAESETWPSTRVQANSVQILFIGGYGAAAAVPDTIKSAMYLLVGHWYENREAVTLAGTPKEVPMAVDALLWAERAILAADSGYD